MLKHLKNLSLLCGVSGCEDDVRNYIIKQIDGKCDYHTDNLGNLIVFKKGKNKPEKKLMIAAHMDEVGMIVTYINDDGTLSFDFVGGVNAGSAVSRQVVVGKNSIPGVVGMKAVHNMSEKERNSSLSVDSMRIDIGAYNREDAEKYVSVGDYVSFVPYFGKLGSKKIAGKALDDRAGCAIMIDLICSELEYDTYFAFTVQEEIGLRGAGAAAFDVDPDIAIVLETTTASDISTVSGPDRVCEVSKGAVVLYMDRRTVYDRKLYDTAFSLAKENKIKCQTKTRIAGGNDSGAIHTSRGGVRTLAISVPCRYLHSPACVADISDIEMCEKLTILLMSGINKL